MCVFLAFRSYLLTLLSGFALFFAISSSCFSQISVDDVIAGIKARESEVREFEIVASLKSEMPPKYAKHIAKQLGKAYGDILRTSAIEYRLALKGPRLLAYEVESDSEAVPRQKGVFDGEIWKAVLTDQERGSVGVKASSDDFLPFELPEKMFLVEGMEIVDYLEREGVRSTAKLIEVDGESLIQIECYRAVDVAYPADAPVDAVLPTQQRKIVLIVDPVRGFWPRKIEVISITKNVSNYDGDYVELQSDVEVVGFHESAGISYPKKVIRRKLMRLTLEQEKEDVIEEKVLTISEVNINSGLPDEHFALAFEKGVMFNDERDHRSYLVDPDGKIQDLTGDRTPLPVSKFTKEQAAEVLGKSTENK